MNLIITSNAEKIKTLCRLHRVKELFVFGSAVRDDFTAGSDVDFLVEFHQAATDTDEEVFAFVDNMDNFQEKLQSLLGRHVDLVRYSVLRNKWLKHFINQEKKLLYAAA